MKVLITGAGGFIGSHVITGLLRGRHEVVALDRSPESFARISHLKPQISTVALDLERLDLVRAFLEKEHPEALMHLAWYGDPRDYLLSKANLASSAMTNAVIEASLSAGCRKFVMSGTCVEYALKDRPLVESDPSDPRTLYAACKHATWLVSRALAAAAGAELSWARIFHLHGPGEDERRLIPWVARELRAGRSVGLTDGTQVRDHLHVADIASGLIALLAPGASGIYNVCSGEPVTLRHVLETVGSVVGRGELLQFGARPHRAEETMYLVGDSTRLRSLGWAPRFGLRDGLVDALAERPPTP
jgi:nucleoside-diphosphate-sugar epimerase